MKFSLTRDFCIWLIPPYDGRVRKVRLTLRLALVMMLLVALFGGTFVFLATDYGRVQAIRAKNHFHLQHALQERDELKVTTESLESEVSSLKTANERVLQYELNVKTRLDELASVVKAATSLGLPSVDQGSAQRKPAGDGIGGAGVDCLKEGRCGALFQRSAFPLGLDLSAPMGISSGGFNALGRQTRRESGEDLIEALDRYISVVKTLPLGIPGEGHINSSFGYRVSPFSGGLKLHEGIDFSLAEGSNIVSTADGVVKTVQFTGTYGLVVDIAHSQSLVTRYAHLSRAMVREGEHVCRGQIIALVGSSGRSTGPHLHYEVRIDDRPRDPMPYVELAAKLNRLLDL